MKRLCYNNTDANKVQYIVSIQPHKAPSNNNFLGLLIDGAGVMSAGLHKFSQYVGDISDILALTSRYPSLQRGCP